jgi:hypothetical protein
MPALAFPTAPACVVRAAPGCCARRVVGTSGGGVRATTSARPAALGAQLRQVRTRGGCGCGAAP